jgi:hypothetical protein
MPTASGMRTGSDQGPAGSSACTSTWPPLSHQLVVIIQYLPSWCRRVGAKMPSEGPAPATSSWPDRSSTLPIWRQDRRSVEAKIGTPGAYSKLEVTRK